MRFASIKWINNNPYSIDYNDIYFNTESGEEEAEYVFIQHNKLKERFASLDKSSFTVIETGFGTGLNFLAIGKHWLALAPASAQLNYISIEKHPLGLEDLMRAHQLWPQFTDISQELLAHYVQLNYGLNQFTLANNRISIELQVDDILEALPMIYKPADAWFLDGFAPKKNAEMWSEEVFNQMARLSVGGTTFATFSSVGDVRRRLQSAGFQVNKNKGFGKKREMLSGVFK